MSFLQIYNCTVDLHMCASYRDWKIKMNFEELCLDTRILRAITEMGFEQASPIQAQAIPVAIEGKDMIGQAQTGTGKTAAFGIPLLQRVDPHNKKLQAVVLCRQENLRYSVQMRCVNLLNLCTE